MTRGRFEVERFLDSACSIGCISGPVMDPVHMPVEGLYSSRRGWLLHIGSYRDRPLLSSVAVWNARAVCMLPVDENVP